MARITLGMNCFWSEARFGSITGIISTKVGYAGGSTPTPTYRNIGDHLEAIQIHFDDDKISFEEILDLFFKSHDPTIKCKRQYMSAIFYQNEKEKNNIEKFIESRRSEFSKPIITEIIKLNQFTDAENYHQKYFLRKYPKLLINSELNEQRLIDSPFATKLNALCAGFGTLDLINSNDLQKLSKENINLLKELIKNGPNLSECGF